MKGRAAPHRVARMMLRLGSGRSAASCPRQLHKGKVRSLACYHVRHFCSRAWSVFLAILCSRMEKRLPNRKKWDGFLTGLAVAISLAWIWPDPGAKDGWMHPALLNKLGVALIFFLHGATLSFASLKDGVLRWKLHLVVQVCTFLLFPLLGWLGLGIFGSRLAPDLQLGLFFLCALPSTVSSSVAMTALARGNVPGAVFNATLSSLLGIFLTPLWIAWMLQTSGESLPLGKVMLDLVLWLFLPLVAGQLARPWCAGFLQRHKKRVHLVDRGVILLLVYTSFCDSVKWGVWQGKGMSTLLITGGASLLLFFTVMWIVGMICKRLNFTIEDRIAAVFCGSKKTLASGVPMAQLMFGANPALSVILLPIIIYHALQLIICSWLANRWAARLS